MPRAGVVQERWAVALLAVAAGVGILVGCERPRDTSVVELPPGPVAVPTPVEWSIEDSAADLAARCKAAESEFDTDTSHWSTVHEFNSGAKVTIVPHRESNQHSMASLAAGKLVAKFVNSGDQAYPMLALPANGTSCLFVQSAKPPSTRGMTARAIASEGSLEHVFEEFHIDFHSTVHGTPLARWYSRFVVDPPRFRQLRPSRASSAGDLPSIFRLAGFSAVAQAGDSTGGSGPGAWTTCASNGCCRVGGLEQ